MLDATKQNMEGIQAPAAAEIGRAKAIIVFDNGGDPKATITPIIARVVPDTTSEIRFVGIVPVADDVHAHANEVVLPLVDRICELLGVPTAGIDAEMVNVGVASSGDKVVAISGLSAELPLFLAALSARLHLPVPQDVVSTGHIGSLEGDIRIVRNMPAKLRAAADDPTVLQFVCPRVHADLSVKALKPTEMAQIEVAMQAVAPRVHIIEVGDVSDAVQVVFRDEDIAIAALRTSFAGAVPATGSGTRAPDRAAKHLCSDLQPRFFKALLARYEAHDAEAARQALVLWAEAHARRSVYPSGFGKELLHLLWGLSPASRAACARRGLLVPSELTRTLTVLALPDDREAQEDLQLLYRAASSSWSHAIHEMEPAAAPNVPRGNDAAETAISKLVACMDPSYLARAVGQSIDSARSSFSLPSAVARSYREFTEVVTSFYVHLLRTTGRATGSTTGGDAPGDAAELVEHAFNREGGFKGAAAEAQAAEQGGLRYVLDKMTYQFKIERQQRLLLGIFADTLDPLDWTSRVEVIKAFRKRFPYALPPDCLEAPPERFAARCEEMLRMFVQAQEPFKQRVRSL